MSNNHNWKHFTKVLEKLGYNQVATYSKVLYFKHDGIKRNVNVEKNNNMSMEYVLRTLGIIGIAYEYFTPLIKKCK